jgi:outer membrane protein TolC
LDFLGSRRETTLGPAVLPELARSAFSFSISQPVLRGFSWRGRIQTAPLLRARFSSEAALEQGRLQAMLTVNITENAYWDLVERIKSYEVTSGALDLAERQLELTRRQIAAGITPGSQLINAEATLAQRELALVQAEAQIDQASDLLRALLNLPEADWDRPLLPVDTPRFLPISVAVAPALERARAGRPEFKRAHIDLKQVALALDVARNDRLPRLDLQAGYDTIGQDRRFRDSFDQALRATGQGWSVGLALSWAPLGTAARAEVRRLESALRQNALTREQVLLEIRGEIRNAVRAIETADRQLRAAARSRELTERSLEVDQRRFVSGLTDNFVIAQRQAEVAAARQAELSALIRHEKAASDMQLAMGDLLEARRLVFSL